MPRPTKQRPATTARRSRSSAPATFVAQSGQNTVSIVDSSHVVIRHLHLEGNNLPVDAVKAEGHAHWAHHITLEDLVIRGHGNNQQTVAISTKCPAWNWVIRGVTIAGAGTGMYLGNSDGSAPRDFDGKARSPGTIGAYSGKPAGGRGWTLQLERKPAVGAGKESP